MAITMLAPVLDYTAYKFGQTGLHNILPRSIRQGNYVDPRVSSYCTPYLHCRKY